jgi:hypothetical protein
MADAAKLYEWAHSRAAVLVQDCWPYIDRVAHALADAGTLNETEIDAILLEDGSLELENAS